MLETWQEELKSAVRSVGDLEGYAFLSAASVGPESQYRTLVPQYYLSLIDPQDPADPVARMAFPLAEEELFSPLGLRDPIGDQAKMVAPRLTHRYDDRALLHVTNLCPMYCRFCFRKNLMNEQDEELYSGDFTAAFQYLAAHPEIEELIFTGGDPWMLSTAKLEGLLDQLEAQVSTIKRLRFHTRMPVTLPSRVNDELVRLLQKKYNFRFVIVTHFNHPKECSPQAAQAIQRLKGTGALLLNQTVLLKGVNDQAATLRKLWLELGAWGVLPYYLHHCDLVRGAEHFRVSLARGREIFRELRGSMPGYYLPHYVLDRPGGAGKISAEGTEIESLETSEYRISGVNFPYEDPITIQ